MKLCRMVVPQIIGIILKASYEKPELKVLAENTHHRGKDRCTAVLQLNKVVFDQKEHMLLFVCSEAVESKLVKLETSHTVILPQQ